MIPRGIQGGGVTGPLLRLLSSYLLLGCLCLAHALRAADRITLAIDASQRVALPGHVSPRAKSGVDRGPVDPSMDLPYVTVALKPSAGQQADLNQLLAQQQDPASPNYHSWLTPDQYADRFGVSPADISKMVAWLGQYGLTVKSIARARNAIAVGGAASQIESAFGVEIHRYQAGGESHYANAADPTIPLALQGVVLAIHGLTDFRLRPMLRPAAWPRDTIGGVHYLGPTDIATIYDITPLYNAGINGTGQKLVVAGQTDVNLSDIENFRNYYGLPVNDPTTVLVPGSQDPGISQSDLPEADLDLELSGAVARDAAILFVNSTDVMVSLDYAVDNNLAPVLSISYGDCELQTALSDAQMFQSWAQQANAQGQTIFAASGDAGAADCFVPDDPDAATDHNTSISVDAPGSVPEVTSVGGTEFNEGSESYWNSTNSSGQASARSYIPEMAWNDSTSEGQPAATGGGVSVYFSKPSWQTGTGVPAGAFRFVPDVSLAASPDHDGYQIYSGGSFQVYGGTSVGPPQFAGITLLLGEYLVANGYQATPGLGNINPSLYALQPVTGVFHDITVGNNIVVPCDGACTLAPIGYDTTVGYDEVTGVGTPDVYNLITAWHGGSVVARGTVTLNLAASAASVVFGGTTVLTATVTSANSGTPTGTVTFTTGDYLLGTATLSGSGANPAATLTLNAVQLAVGANTITAQYNGDTSYDGATATASVTVTSSANGPPTVGGVSNAASYTQSFAPGGILSIFGLNLAPATASAETVPLPTMLAGTSVSIGGVTASLYYVSPTQLNIQIPYEVSLGSTSTLRVENNQESAFYNNFVAAAAAPAIFTTNAQGTGQGAILNTSYQLVDASHPATPGSTYIQIYCMGLGAVSNQPSDGAASPSSPLARTAATPVVTIGNVPATVSFSGLAPGFVGEYQVNALVPASVTAGSAVPVAISIGGAASNTVTIVVGP
ncbi:MAG: protease pro-enzyme activation domain-containing protein [Bryobacteraceae bacterium]|jgi:uncharacterized protein (TIGR03437 family)